MKDDNVTLATREALKVLDQLEEHFRNLAPQLGSRKSRTSAKLIFEGFVELRERIAELDGLTTLAQRQGADTGQNRTTVPDRVFRVWGQHEAIDLARQQLGVAWDALKDLLGPFM